MVRNCFKPICIFVAIVSEPLMFALRPAVAQQSIDSPAPGAPGFEEMGHAYDKLSKGELEEAIRFARRARGLAPDAEAPVRLLVDALTKLGRFQEALTTADDYVRSHRPSASLLLQRANVRERLKNFEGAAADIRRARDQGGLTKEQQEAAAAALYQATLAPAFADLAAGKFHAAIEAAEKARELDPEAEAPVRVLMEAHEKLGQPAEALAAAERYASQHPASWQLLAQRGYLRRSLQDLKGAQADFKAALTKSDLPSDQADKLRNALAEAELAQAQRMAAPGDEELERAYKALAAGNLSTATREARAARAKDAKAEGPVLVLMTALQRLRQPRAALKEADLFLRENRASPALLAQRGYIRRSISDLSGAISDFRASLASPGLDTKQAENVRAALEEALRAQGRPGAEAVEEAATPVERALNRAYDALKFRDFKGAVRAAREARNLDPSSETPTLVLMDALNKLGRKMEALAEADRFLRDSPSNGTVLAQRGYLRRAISDLSGAISDFEAALSHPGLDAQQEKNVRSALAEARRAERQPSGEAATPVEQALNRAYDALQARNFDEAVRAAREARELDPSSETPTLVLMDALSKLGRKKEALAEADRFLRANPASAKVLAQRGYLRRAMSDLSGAISDFEAALSHPGLDAQQEKNVRSALAEARRAERQPSAEAATPVEQALNRAYDALKARDFEEAVRAAREARELDPSSETPTLVLMDALSKLGRKKEALAEADRFLRANPPSANVLAQRGYLRRAMSDLSGAISDFEAALSHPGLDAQQEKNVRSALAEARRAERQPSAEAATPVEQALNRAYDALKARDFEEAVRAAREARELDPSSETPTLVLMDALNKLGKKQEAIAEAGCFLRDNPPSAKVLAQRGFLRRQTKDVAGAISDFCRALALGTLPPQQKATVSEALDEARYFLVADKAFKAASAQNWPAALKYSRMAQAFRRADEAIFRVSIEALAQLKRVDKALRESDALIARGKASGQAYAQRGFLREQVEDHAGAAADFATALARGGLAPGQRKEVARALAIAKSSAFEAMGDKAAALAMLLDYARQSPGDAKIWAALGRFYSRQKQHAEALAAFETSLAIERSGEIVLSAGYESTYVDRAKESRYFREALDRWSSDPTLKTRPERDREMVKAQVVEADASIRTNIDFGNIAARPKRWGGYQNEPSMETAIRFDGRYLPFVTGLEGFVGGRWSQDQTRFTESFARVGLRFRPFDGINFSVSGEFQHRFDPRPLDQFALSWAYGYGGFVYTSGAGGAAEAGALQAQAATNYPFESGWRLLTSFATYGTYRTGEHRYLQDALGLLGVAYWSVAPFRAVIGPTAMAAGSYDNLDKRRFAFGIGPALVFRLWLGGDDYRAFDGLITVQIGYLFPFGESRRQGGLRTRIGFTF